MSNLQKKAKEQVASYADPNTPISSGTAKIYHQMCFSPLQVKICVHAQLSPMLCFDGFVSTFMLKEECKIFVMDDH